MIKYKYKHSTPYNFLFGGYKMKKFLSALLLATMIPLSTFAISLSDLQSPDKYKIVTERTDDTIYIDETTIQSIRYAPPYYTIQCVYYIAAYSDDMIFEIHSVFDYNYNRSSSELLGIVLGYSTSEEIDKNLVKECMKDSGMQFGITSVKCYKLDGTFSENLSSSSHKNCEPNSAPYLVANYVFKKCYNEAFAFEFQHS